MHLMLQRARFVNDDDSNHANQCPYCQVGADFCHLLSSSHSGALKTHYDASDTLRKAIKGHVRSYYLDWSQRCTSCDESRH